ncbi:mRNA splicing protein prp18 [Gonapodya sp. JEL0774]|nr:mRNA splicing protein prp18 [Gonapodya sp. JEL0774]
MSDPLAILQAEIERKRKAGDPGDAVKAVTTANGVKKYKRRGDIESERLQEERRREEELRRKMEDNVAIKKAALLNVEEERQRERSNTPEASRLATSGTGTPKRGSRDVTPTPESTEESADQYISSTEVVRRLRSRGEPIRLFGETDLQRINRLRVLESKEEKNEGQRNEFMRAMEATDKRLAMETIQKGAGVVDEEAIRRKAKEEAELMSVDTSPISVDLLMKDPDRTYHLLSVYFRRKCFEWEKDLDARSDEEKRSNDGKKREAMFRQTMDYLKPFFKSLKQKNMDADVVARISEIAAFLHQREYQKANNAYLTLSIGNSPWPIGVTMVGIHERSAREKIFAAQVAHVLNDETTRKWIQSLKRLMSWMQDKYPPSEFESVAVVTDALR